MRRAWPVFVLAAAAFALVGGLSARAAGDVFSGTFSCSGGVCTGTLVDPAGGPTIEGFYLGGGTFTNLTVNGHPGNVGTNGPGGAEEILFSSGSFIMPASTTTFTFSSSPPPSSLIVTPTFDQQSYGTGVTFSSPPPKSCTAQSSAVSRLKKKIASVEKKIAHATGATKASLEKQLSSLEKSLATAQSALSSCQK